MITFKFIINSRLGAYLKFIIYEYQTFCVYDIEVFPLFSVRLPGEIETDTCLLNTFVDSVV